MALLLIYHFNYYFKKIKREWKNAVFWTVKIAVVSVRHPWHSLKWHYQCLPSLAGDSWTSSGVCDERKLCLNGGRETKIKTHRKTNCRNTVKDYLNWNKKLFFHGNGDVADEETTVSVFTLLYMNSSKIRGQGRASLLCCESPERRNSFLKLIATNDWDPRVFDFGGMLRVQRSFFKVPTNHHRITIYVSFLTIWLWLT